MKDHSEHKMDEAVYTAIAVAREALYDRISKEEEKEEVLTEEESEKAFNVLTEDVERILVKLALAVRAATLTHVDDTVITFKLNSMLKDEE